jgi:predicted transposase YbfD/YdcC
MEILSDVRDDRRRQGLRYELVHILLFSVFAVLSGADSYRKIHIFTETHYEFLNDCFGLNWKKIPAHTAVRNIIRGVSAASPENAFEKYSQKLAEGTEGTFIAFDGKVLRGSFDHFKDKKAAQCLSAFMTDSRIIIAHREIEAKTNEIPAAQELIMKLGLKNKIFTFDAMHCREKTLKTAKESGNEAIVQVKGNQKTLLNDCIKTSETMTASDSYEEPAEKTRNRTESRKTEVYEDMIVTDSEKRGCISAIVKAERKREIFDTKTGQWKKTDEISYYVSTAVLSANEFCKGIRGHRGIENSDHCVRDVSMNEDR